MNLPDIERFVAELLATGEMNDDTRADLERILAEARAGQSHADDLDYLAALHARVLSTGDAIPAEPVAATAPQADSAALHAEIERLRAELAEARQTIAELETRLATGP
jgi:hypothetical protein